MDDQANTEVEEPASRDGFAAMAILLVTVIFIVVVILALL